MAIIINDNIRVNAGKPVDAKYLSSANTPYTSIAAVNAAITIPERHVGLTVNVMGVEYWYTGVTTSPIQKKYDSTIPSGDFVTGATNIGFFSGLTGVQSLLLNKAGGTTYDGWYYSTYGWYYRGTDGKIYAGTPSDGIPKRAYINSVLNKSWIWNEYINIGTGDQLGWILTDGNIQNFLGVFVNGVLYYPPSIPYTQTFWITGTNPNNGSGLVVDVINGSLTTGTTITVGAPLFNDKAGRLLEFRTLQTKSPNTLSVSYDEAFVYVSGKTQITQGTNVGGGNQIFKNLSGNTLQFRTIIGSGDTQVTQVGDNVVIWSQSGTGGTGGGTYNLSSPAAITVGGISGGTVLTGKTSFQLFEELLVPALNPSLTPPSSTFAITSPSGSQFEVGQTFPMTFSVSFSRGSIAPPYGTSGFRSGAFVRYNFTGTGIPATGTTAPSIGSYGVLAGGQSWSGTASYLIGEQPKNSKGANYSTPLPAGTTGGQTASITGIYPYFWGVSNSLPVAGQLLINGGNKVVSPSNGNVTVNYNASGQYIWLAIPTASGAKVKWFGSNAPTTNTEPIPGGLFNAATPITVNSPTSLWSSQGYDFYISNYATNTIGYTITFQ